MSAMSVPLFVVSRYSSGFEFPRWPRSSSRPAVLLAITTLPIGIIGRDAAPARCGPEHLVTDRDHLLD